MKLDCVLTAVNENSLYIDFIPIFVKTWNKLYPNVDVKIILIALKIPENFLPYKNNIILFNPIDGILTSFTSQYIRLLYPAILNYNNGILITDIDMIPMNNSYYSENIKAYDDDKFIYYREYICQEHNMLAMCYNIATPKIWSDIFNINSIEDIVYTLKYVYSTNEIIEGHGNKGWGTDQLKLYEHVTSWHKNTGNLIRLKESNTKFHRLDRIHFKSLSPQIKNNIKNGIYCDYHCHRPYSKYSDLVNEIYEAL